MIDESSGPAERVEIFGGGIDPECVKNCGEQIIRMDGISFRIGGDAVRFAVHRAEPNSSARDQATVTVRPMIAAARPDVVGRGRSQLG